MRPSVSSSVPSNASSFTKSFITSVERIMMYIVQKIVLLYEGQKSLLKFDYKMSHFNSKQHSLGGRSKRNIQQQFIHHCAVVIQSRVKGYIQRKKYKAFLPIYRRVKELFFAIFSGWKTRRIMKLPTVKGQINNIRLKLKNGQVSSARIAKRELVDEIERLGKKGTWIEVYHKFRMMKSKNPFDGKENSSLYGNIKSKSIKNVFKEPSVKIDKQNIKPSKNLKEEIVFSHRDVAEQTKKIDQADSSLIDFDERPLKGIHSISVCPTEPQIVQITKNQGDSRHDYLKRNQKKDTKKIVPKTSRTKDQKIKVNKQIETKKTIIPENSFEICTKPETMKCSQVSNTSKASKKLQVTLSKNLISSVKSIQSIKAINESTIDLKTLQASRSSLTFSKPELNLEVFQVYQNKYLKQKAKLVEKLMGMDFKYTQKAGKHYQQRLSKY